MVKDLYKDRDEAYLCVLRADASGHIAGTDESLDVHQYGLTRLHGSWLAVPIGEGLAESSDRVDCRVDDQAVQSAQTIRALIKQALVQRLTDGLDFGKIDADALATFQQLGAWLPDFDIEHPKQGSSSASFGYTDSDLALARRACASQACRDENQQAYGSLKALADDPQVSSLVWSNCQYGRRMQNLSVVARCVHEAAPRHACRQHMAFVKDRADIDRCLAAVADTCQRLNFASAADRQRVCGH